MRSKCVLLLITTILLLSCRKEKITDGIAPGTPLPPDPPVQAVLLKDIEIPHLPSPYYHFEYNTAGKVSFVSFASGLNKYNVIYDGGRISEMRNNIIVNNDTLRYSYDNEGKVSAIRYINEAGSIYTVVFFTYDGQKLIELERNRKSVTGFIVDKIMTMSYHPDGNLKELTYHYLPFNGQPDQIFTDRFEQYDNKTNVDGFSLLHNEFFDHLVFLPGVRLQKNNPGRESRIGDAENYTVDYIYTYNNNDLPLTKKGNLIFLTGSDAGQQFETNSVFSYY
jgi:hypothetical protein